MAFMVAQGEPPFTIHDGTLTINPSTPPALSGSIYVPNVISEQSIAGTQVDSPDGFTTTFNFMNADQTINGYGMTIICGDQKKLMGGANIPTLPGLPSGDPNQDACWVATHSGAGNGDDDDAGKHGQRNQGR
jgi:hypothetical protein